MKPGDHFFVRVEDLDTMTTAYQLRRVVEVGPQAVVTVEPVEGYEHLFYETDDVVPVTEDMARMIVSYARYVTGSRLDDYAHRLYVEADINGVAM